MQTINYLTKKEINQSAKTLYWTRRILSDVSECPHKITSAKLKQIQDNAAEISKLIKLLDELLNKK